MAVGYKPFKGSLAERVLQFFEANADEVLTADDIADKYGRGRASVHTCLAKCVDVGYLVREKQPDGQYVYTRGTKPVATTRAARDRSIGEISIEDGIPIPPQRSGRDNDYARIFTALAQLQPGQSFAVARDKRPTLQKAVSAANKLPNMAYTTRAVTDDEVRVWRVS